MSFLSSAFFPPFLLLLSFSPFILLFLLSLLLNLPPPSLPSFSFSFHSLFSSPSSFPFLPSPYPLTFSLSFPLSFLPSPLPHLPPTPFLPLTFPLSLSLVPYLSFIPIPPNALTSFLSFPSLSPRSFIFLLFPPIFPLPLTPFFPLPPTPSSPSPPTPPSPPPLPPPPLPPPTPFPLPQPLSFPPPPFLPPPPPSFPSPPKPFLPPPLSHLISLAVVLQLTIHNVNPTHPSAPPLPQPFPCAPLRPGHLGPLLPISPTLLPQKAERFEALAPSRASLARASLRAPLLALAPLGSPAVSPLGCLASLLPLPVSRGSLAPHLSRSGSLLVSLSVLLSFSSRCRSCRSCAPLVVRSLSVRASFVSPSWRLSRSVPSLVFVGPLSAPRRFFASLSGLSGFFCSSLLGPSPLRSPGSPVSSRFCLSLFFFLPLPAFFSFRGPSSRRRPFFSLIAPLCFFSLFCLSLPLCSLSVFSLSLFCLLSLFSLFSLSLSLSLGLSLSLSVSLSFSLSLAFVEAGLYSPFSLLFAWFVDNHEHYPGLLTLSPIRFLPAFHSRFPLHNPPPSPSFILSSPSSLHHSPFLLPPSSPLLHFPSITFLSLTIPPSPSVIGSLTPLPSPRQAGAASIASPPSFSLLPPSPLLSPFLRLLPSSLLPLRHQLFITLSSSSVSLSSLLPLHYRLSYITLSSSSVFLSPPSTPFIIASPPPPSSPPLPPPLLYRLSPSTFLHHLSPSLLLLPSSPFFTASSPSPPQRAPAKLEREDSENTQLRRAICEAREGAQRKAAKRKPDVVLSRSYPGATVHEEYACMLNQTNIGQNNNKFYVIQVAKDSGDFLCFTRWGRVHFFSHPPVRQGEEGQWNIDCMEKAEDAIKAFEKKFKDKTRNNWADRDNFEPVAKKYTLLEMGECRVLSVCLSVSLPQPLSLPCPSPSPSLSMSLPPPLSNPSMSLPQPLSVHVPSPTPSLSISLLSISLSLPDSFLSPSPSLTLSLHLSSPTPSLSISLPQPPLCPSPFPNPLSVHLPLPPLLYDDSDEEEDAVDSSVPKKELVSYDGPCNLHKRTILMIKLIFSDNMFVNQMADMSLDVKKMPLGKLSKLQIAKGLEALIDIEDAIKKNKPRSVLMELTSKFYTLIPHNFGRSAPPVIDTDEVVQKKKEVMLTLSDIELTQSLQKEKGGEKRVRTNLHPLLEKYEMLDCVLEYVEKSSSEFMLLKEYATACPQTRKGPLLDVWRVDRKGEKERFAAHDAIQHRKLLWHGTNVAVVAAILKAGLRIMPHSGGLVGRGIYFASEHAKSSWYVRSHCGIFEGESNVGFMFLVEVALGRESSITQCDGSLTKAPNGYDSVVARGSREPDPKKNKKVVFDGKDVIVPVGKPVPQKEWAQSGFCQSEYLVYKESQARIRYVLKFSFN
ncbi:poly [Penaeus vannamei]|uniref:Poly [ADP-ribose] polymerase n=1 Tax=Penaeus vannamei TaxID=6689 RepID=A0A3R7LWK6_PENVA|nr:poly [Penaeus vannamei]